MRADVLDPTRLSSIRRREIQESRSASDTKLKVSRIIIFHLRVGESRTRIPFGVVNENVVLYSQEQHSSTDLLSVSIRPKEE